MEWNLGIPNERPNQSSQNSKNAVNPYFTWLVYVQREMKIEVLALVRPLL